MCTIVLEILPTVRNMLYEYYKYPKYKGKLVVNRDKK